MAEKSDKLSDYIKNYVSITAGGFFEKELNVDADKIFKNMEVGNIERWAEHQFYNGGYFENDFLIHHPRMDALKIWFDNPDAKYKLNITLYLKNKIGDITYFDLYYDLNGAAEYHKMVADISAIYVYKKNKKEKNHEPKSNAR